MTSATDELRRLLEERGEDYMRNDFGITWSYYSDPHTATESMDGTLIVTGLTPEQAIAATLGRGTLTAEDVRSFLNRNSVFDDTTWPHGRQELVFDEDDLQAMADELNATLGRGTCRIEHRGMGYYCSECGAMVGSDDVTSELHIDANAIELWGFCPRCGAVVTR